MPKSHLVVRVQKFPSFIRKHSKLLSAIGALIVFGTFIIKDAFRDKVKDQKDFVESTALAVASRRDLAQLEGDISALYSFVHDIDVHVRETRSGRGEKRMSEVFEHMRILSLMGDALARQGQINGGSATQLSKSFDVDEESVAALKEGQQKLEAAEKRLEDWNVDFEEEATDSKEALSEKGEAKATDSLGKILNDIDVCTADLGRIADKILQEAEAATDRLERRYEFYTRASWILYTLGWALALGGRLLGVEDIPAGS